MAIMEKESAHAADLTDVVIPERNRADLEDVPEDVRGELTFHPVMTLDEVLSVALEPARADAAEVCAYGRAGRQGFAGAWIRGCGGAVAFELRHAAG